MDAIAKKFGERYKLLDDSKVYRNALYRNGFSKCKLATEETNVYVKAEKRYKVSVYVLNAGDKVEPKNAKTKYVDKGSLLSDCDVMTMIAGVEPYSDELYEDANLTTPFIKKAKITADTDVFLKKDKTQIDSIMKILGDTTEYKVVDPAGLAAFNLLGLKDETFPTGNYILFENDVPEGYYRNPVCYTLYVDWTGDEYTATADIGMLLPLVRSEYEEFIHVIEKQRTKLNEQKLVDENLIAAMAKILTKVSSKYKDESAASAAIINQLGKSGNYTFDEVEKALNELVKIDKLVNANPISFSEDWVFYNIKRKNK